MELSTEKFPVNTDLSLKKYNRIEPIDNKTDITSSINLDKTDNHQHRHHHHHHHRHHHRPHHHHHHHHHRHRSYSPDSPSTYYSHNFGHHHHFHAAPIQRIVTPKFPKIITPFLPKINTKTYRDTGINTGNETKIMRDSSVTADLDDIQCKFKYIFLLLFKYDFVLSFY
jgi:ABC-type Zn2+ transport system substrate-binding protein/surface adhesin